MDIEKDDEKSDYGYGCKNFGISISNGKLRIHFYSTKDKCTKSGFVPRDIIKGALNDKTLYTNDEIKEDADCNVTSLKFNGNEVIVSEDSIIFNGVDLKKNFEQQAIIEDTITSLEYLLNDMTKYPRDKYRPKPSKPLDELLDHVKNYSDKLNKHKDDNGREK